MAILQIGVGQFYHLRIEVLQIAQLLAIVIFVSVSLVRENLRGLRENLSHTILSPARPLGGCHGTLDDAKRHNGLAALDWNLWRPY